MIVQLPQPGHLHHPDPLGDNIEVTLMILKANRHQVATELNVWEVFGSASTTRWLLPHRADKLLISILWYLLSEVHSYHIVYKSSSLSSLSSSQCQCKNIKTQWAVGRKDPNSIWKLRRLGCVHMFLHSLISPMFTVLTSRNQENSWRNVCMHDWMVTEHSCHRSA